MSFIFSQSLPDTILLDWAVGYVTFVGGAVCALHCPDIGHLVPRGVVHSLTQLDVRVHAISAECLTLQLHYVVQILATLS